MSGSLLFDPAWVGDASVQGPRESDSLGDFDQNGLRGMWPRMIKLDKEAEERLRLWIDEEIQNFNQERAPLLENWRTWHTGYWAAPATKEKNFPFKRAANTVVPLQAIAVEATHARQVNTLFSVEPFYSIRPRSKEWIQAANPFQKYLQTEVEANESLNMFKFCTETLLELDKLGTCVGKSGYERLTKKSLRRRGDREEEFFVQTRNGPTVGRVPLPNFILRFNETDPQTAPMVGEKHKFSWSQMKSMAQDGRMGKNEVGSVKSYWIQHNQSSEPSDGDQVLQKVEELGLTEPTWAQEFDVYELWISFDVDGDGWDEEIVVDYHKESRTFLSIRYNWYDDLHRPYHICQFFPVEGVWPGIGICKMVEQFQEEATTIHRQRLDNATLANMTQIVLKRNVGYGPGEPIFPGKMWFFDDPTKDIVPLKLSEVYGSSFANEESVTRLYEKRSGINEVILGLPHEGTPGTATSDLTRLSEGKQKFDLTLKHYRKFASSVGYDIVTNLQIFGNQQVHWLVLGEDGAYVEQVLNMPSTLVRRGAFIDLTVTDSITNKDVEQQKWLSLFQVVTNYYNTVLQLAQLFGPQVFGQVAQRALQASDEAMRRLLETFDVVDSDRFSLVEESPENGGTAESSRGVVNRLSQPGGQGSPALPGIKPSVGFVPPTNGNGTG